jgi:CBS domain-containing protein
VHSKENGELIGVLDRLDILRYILSNRSKHDSVVRMLRKCEIADPHIHLNEVVMHFRTGRRYISICQDGETKLISQTSILEHIVSFESDEELQMILSSTIEELNIGQLTPICCKCSDTALSAFETMAAYNITSLPIVDNADCALGVISASDIFLARDCKEHLSRSVIEYVEHSRRELNVDRHAHCIVSCAYTDKLADVIRLMMHEKIHHVYVTRDSIPVGVVSFVDILRTL